MPSVLSLQAVDQISRDLSELVFRRTRAGVRHAMRLQPVARIAHCSQLMSLARELAGPAVFPYRATIFEKTPTANWLVVWHQDTAMPLQQRQEIPGWGPWSIKDGIPYAHAPASSLEQVLALRIHLDDSTRENGPLRVLPGTHRWGVLSDDEIQKLANSIRPVDCVALKGGVIAMRPLVVHASSKLRNGTARKVIHIEYAASESIASPLRPAVA